MDIVGRWFTFGKNEHYDEGIRLYQLGEYLDAIEQFKICLSSDPDVSTRERARSYMAGSLGKLARRSVAEGEWARALHFLDDAITLRPGFADLRILRAQVFDALGKHEDRMFEVRFSLDLNPQYGFAILHDGIYKMEHGEGEGGIARVRESILADPRLDSDKFQEAMAAFEAGRVEEAIQGFKGVVPVMRADPEEIAKGADAYAQDRRWSDAEEAYRRAIEVAPGFADFRCKHGQVLLQLDEVEQAIAEFREAVTINPRYTDAYAMLGVALRRAGREEEAVEAFRAALQFDPGHAVASVEILRKP
ncbi:MAG: tetratricopeptide repeat protein [Fimbriimonadaceae bacterium]